MVSPRDSKDPRSTHRRLFSPAHEAERAQVGKRLLWALPAVVVILALLILLGPSAEVIERKFTPYGADGPLQIMPEISIEDGIDPVRRRTREDAAPPPAAPNYDIEPDDTDARTDNLVPEVQDTTAPQVDAGESTEAPADAVQAIDRDGNANVDMFMPSQHVDSDFIIRKLVRPLYPARAGAADRLRPLITVTAAFFVNEQAEIVAVMIQGNDGGPEFADAARTAMEQWVFEPRLRDGKPPASRWLVVKWRFRSPFSVPAE